MAGFKSCLVNLSRPGLIFIKGWFGRGGYRREHTATTFRGHSYNRGEIIMTRTIIVLSAVLFAGAAGATDKTQVCSGILTKDERGYLLKPDPGSSPWCDAYIGDDYHIGDASTLRVPKVCQIGSRCNIAGSFVGHGVFYWRHVTSVSSGR
jgi:hypothetical protein